MGHDAAMWPYGPTLLRLALALGIGLFVGIERERRQKEAGLRTFAFASLLGGVGGLLDTRFALLALGLLGILVVFLNLETIHTGEGAEITTSAALFVTGFAGVLAGQGHTFTPTALGIVTAGLLAWKEPLAGFSRTLTESEFRSAVLLGILAFVVYPVLPEGTIDPWRLIAPRAAWITVILIAALGFANYVLFKLYGARGIELTGFLGGLVNSTVTVTELSRRGARAGSGFADAAFRGVILATAAMIVRNAVILLLLAPSAFRFAMIALALMLAAVGAALITPRVRASHDMPSGSALPTLESPFSPLAAVRFGLVFLGLQVAATLAQRSLGTWGFYAVSLAGGVISSASAVASAANLAASGTLSPEVAGVGAAIASAASVLVDFPIVARLGHDPVLTRRVGTTLGITTALGGVGLLLQWLWLRL